MEFGSLALTLINRVDQTCDDYEAAWRAGQRPRIEDALSKASGSEQIVFIRALLALELELRRDLGERPTPGEYLGRFQAYDELVLSIFGAESATFSPRPSALNATDEPVLANYEILGELGRGGMGVVYRARDRRSDHVVALKTFPQAAPAALLRFKREFRTLADVFHTNLVTLYELASDGRCWFFTMEYIDGVDILAFVRSPDGALAKRVALVPGPSDVDIRRLEGSAAVSQPRSSARRSESPSIGLAPVAGLPASQMGRLRAAFVQLAEGIVALHEAGKLHRDIKPSNVLATRGGRIVLLDFGLATELEPSGLHLSSEPHVLGTVAYMAPEQAASQPVSQAGDWYSVGVMLYEALTSRLPYTGRPLEILLEKQRSDPLPPNALVPDLPEDLSALCIDLLRRDPGARPRSPEVLHRLRGRAEPKELFARVRSSAGSGTPLVGRAEHLEALDAALAAAGRGRTAVLLLRGRSGIGKSALVKHFLNGLHARGGPVILAGRCYEQESVPYKALDMVIDSLSRFLRRLPVHEARALLPRDILLLTQVFPVLRQAEAIATAPRRTFEIPDPHELRRRAFAAFRELLARIGDQHPLVLAIDDLQWGDIDSATALTDLLRAPDSPPLLFLGCYRDEDVESSPFLRALPEWRKQLGTSGDWHELTVGCLTSSEARDLARNLLELEGGVVEQADVIALESGGSPFFIAELVRHLQTDAGPQRHPIAATGISLDEVLWSRILRLPVAARRLLEVVAVSGRPLSIDVARQSAGLGHDERESPSLLRAGRLIRGTGTDGGEEVETYHDRVREVVAARLSPLDLGNYHRNLAQNLEASGRADFEVLAVHYWGAGEPARAGEFFARAAEQAAAALAFDRAATLYRRVLELRASGEGEERCLRIRLADALADAGRCSEAAREYFAAATGAGRTEGLRLKQRAGYQLLISGHVDEGLKILGTVLKSMDLRLPDSPRRSLLNLLVNRAILQVRGLNFQERDGSRIPPEELDRVDIARGIAVGLSVVDWIRGASFQARCLLLSLRAGEPLRVALALAWEAVISACRGRPARLRTARLLSGAEVLSQRLGHPHALGMAALAKGASEFLGGRFLAGLEISDRAEAILRGHATGVNWELDRAQIFGLLSLFYSGRVSELGSRSPRVVQEARERGNLYQESTIEAGVAFLPRLAADRVDEARVRATEAIGRWSQQGFHFQHLTYFFTSNYTDLYAGDAASAWARVGRIEPLLRASQLLRIEFVRIDVLEHSGRAAVAAAAAARDPRPLLYAAERYARRLDRHQVPWARGLALLIRAGMASVQSDADGAVTLLTAASAAFDAVDMGLFAASARRRLGELLGGTAGCDLMAQADAWMAGQGIRNPARMATCVAPGFPDR